MSMLFSFRGVDLCIGTLLFKTGAFIMARQRQKKQDISDKINSASLETLSELYYTAVMIDDNKDTSQKILYRTAELLRPVTSSRGIPWGEVECRIPGLLLAFRYNSDCILFIDFLFDRIGELGKKEISNRRDKFNGRCYTGNGLFTYISKDETSRPEQLAIEMVQDEECRKKRQELTRLMEPEQEQDGYQERFEQWYRDVMNPPEDGA